MNHPKSIGIFDSGVGGISIFNEIHALLPNEKIIYLADRKYAPYGEKSKQAIRDRSFRITEQLLKMGAKTIVVACNTATTNAIKELRGAFDLPFVGIEPAIKPAALQSTHKTIGVLATRGTLTSDLFAQTAARFTQGMEIIEVVGTGLVEAIEAGQNEAPETRDLLENLLQPILQKPVDYLVLGCTHYPFLTPLFEKILPKNIKVIDSGQAVARQTKTILQSFDQLAPSPQGIPEFYTNGETRFVDRYIRAKDYTLRYLDF